MKVVWFRFVNEKGEPTGHMGMAAARNMAELFCEIDRYGDPNSVEVVQVSRGSFCVESVDDEFDSLEVSEEIPREDCNQWIKLDWPDLSELY